MTNHKTVVITGGSSGIGRATAEWFAERGWRVFEWSRSGTSTDRVAHICCDVTDPEQTRAAARQVLEQAGTIDVLISNAGYGISGAIEFTTPEDAHRQMDVNFFGALNSVQAVLPHMRERKAGRIIFTSSVAAVLSIPYQSFYACIRGGFAACHDAKVRIGAKVYGATTLGPHCKIGGEVENSVFIGYSNKAHDGFLGDAVIGEWCNIGGGTTASNLKNDYGEIKLWNYATKRFERTGLQFCGLFMGDHSKIGVNGMINTATVLGVGVNIHGAGFPRNFVASFQEGSATAGFKDVPLETFYTIAQRVMKRRNIELTDAERDIYKAIYNIRDRYK